MRGLERKCPALGGASIWAVAAPNRNHPYREMPKGARKAGCTLRPEAGRRWHP